MKNLKLAITLWVIIVSMSIIGFLIASQISSIGEENYNLYDLFIMPSIFTIVFYFSISILKIRYKIYLLPVFLVFVKTIILLFGDEVAAYDFVMSGSFLMSQIFRVAHYCLNQMGYNTLLGNYVLHVIFMGLYQALIIYISNLLVFRFAPEQKINH